MTLVLPWKTPVAVGIERLDLWKGPRSGGADGKETEDEGEALVGLDQARVELGKVKVAEDCMRGAKCQRSI
jgi:hypothetical protein